MYTFFKKERKKNMFFILLSVESDAVRVSLFEKTNDDLYSFVIHENRSVPAPNEEISIHTLISEIDSLRKDFGIIIEGLFFEVYGSQYFGKTEIVSYKRVAADSPVTVEEIHDVISEIEEGEIPSDIEIFHELSEIKENFSFAGSILTRFVLNSSEEDFPIGKTGSDAEISLFRFFVERTLLGLFTELSKKLRIDISAIIPRSFAFSEIWSNASPQNVYLSLDISSAGTNLSLFSEGIILEALHLNISTEEFLSRDKSHSQEGYLSSGPLYTKEEIFAEKIEREKILERVKDVMEILSTSLEVYFQKREGVQKNSLSLYIFGDTFHLKNSEEVIRKIFSFSRTYENIYICSDKDIGEIYKNDLSNIENISFATILTCTFFSNYLDQNRK